MKKTRYTKERIQTIVSLLKEKNYNKQDVLRIKKYIIKKRNWVKKYNSQRQFIDSLNI